MIDYPADRRTVACSRRFKSLFLISMICLLSSPNSSIASWTLRISSASFSASCIFPLYFSSNFFRNTSSFDRMASTSCMRRSVSESVATRKGRTYSPQHPREYTLAPLPSFSGLYHPSNPYHPHQLSTPVGGYFHETYIAFQNFPNGNPRRHPQEIPPPPRTMSMDLLRICNRSKDDRLPAQRRTQEQTRDCQIGPHWQVSSAYPAERTVPEGRACPRAVWTS